jgi:hypothetical protein
MRAPSADRLSGAAGRGHGNPVAADALDGREPLASINPAFLPSIPGSPPRIRSPVVGAGNPSRPKATQPLSGTLRNRPGHDAGKGRQSDGYVEMPTNMTTHMPVPAVQENQPAARAKMEPASLQARMKSL